MAREAFSRDRLESAIRGLNVVMMVIPKCCGVKQLEVTTLCAEGKVKTTPKLSDLVS